jgi:hypothetical protein
MPDLVRGRPPEQRAGIRSRGRSPGDDSIAVERRQRAFLQYGIDGGIAERVAGIAATWGSSDADDDPGPADCCRAAIAGLRRAAIDPLGRDTRSRQRPGRDSDSGLQVPRRHAVVVVGSDGHDEENRREQVHGPTVDRARPHLNDAPVTPW